jgi:hypothetical protein
MECTANIETWDLRSTINWKEILDHQMILRNFILLYLFQYVFNNIVYLWIDTNM